MDDCTKSSRIIPAAVTRAEWSLAPAGWLVLFAAGLLLAGFVAGVWWGRG